ncbi:hypothetical protein IWZ01DRAFT_320271 [Phyllosticta capitalensis]
MTRPLNSKAPMAVAEEAKEVEAGLEADLEAALVIASLISSVALLNPAPSPLAARRRSPVQAAAEEAAVAAAVEEVEVVVVVEEVEEEDLVADQFADLWASFPTLLSSARRTSRPCASPVSRTRELAATWARCQRAALATSTAQLVPMAKEVAAVEDKEEDFAALNNKALVLALAVEVTHWLQTRTQQLRTPTRSDGQAAATSSTRATRVSSTPRASVAGARRRRAASSRSSKLFPLSSFLSMDGWSLMS